MQFSKTKLNWKERIYQRYKNTDVWKDWHDQCEEIPNPFEQKFEPKLVDVSTCYTQQNKGQTEKRDETPMQSIITNREFNEK